MEAAAALIRSSLQRFNVLLLLKSSEPGIGKDVAGAIGRPARRIHFAMRFHNRVMVAHLAAALAQIAD